MLRYIVKRCCYSLLIIPGVLILTFCLFQLASGDPAQTVLGKNPSPEELEDMRETLGSSKPLFFGKWKDSLLYGTSDFTGAKMPPSSVRTEGKVTALPRGLELSAGSALIFERQFERQNVKEVRMTVFFGDGSKDLTEIFTGTPPRIRISFPEKRVIRKVAFQIPGRHFLDSQLLASVKELVTFKTTYPYVTFFNFGNTLQTREPIREKLWQGMIPSLLLMLPVFLGELVLGIILGMLSCIRHGKLTDQVILCLSVAGMSISYLVLIIFGQWFFAYYLNWFPVWGWGDIRYLLLPVAIGILSGTGGGVRFYRTVFLDEMNREYIRTARAKGLSGMTVYFKHLLKNALIPVITRASTVLPFLFTGSLLLETFFGIPGLGHASINALNDSDLQMLKALVVLSALLFTFINLITDLAYAWADPRVRLR